MMKLKILCVYNVRETKLELLRPVVEELTNFEERRLAAEARTNQVPL